jgi:ribosomal protein S6
MRKYRLVLILKRALDKKAVEGLVSEVKKIAGDVKNDKLTDLGEKKFSFPIKKELSGNYLVLEFETDSVSPELENRIKLNDNILRHLMVRVD